MTLLSMLWTLPALGAASCALGGLLGRRVSRGLALLFATAHLTLAAFAFYLHMTGGTSAVTGPFWAYGISYSIACDGLSASLIALTAFLTLVSVLASWELEVGAGYWVSFMALSAALCGVFLARDLFFFYLFWEATLIPMFFIIGLWGSENRRKAAVKFFLFTFAGSIFMLLGLLAVVSAHHGATGTWTWRLAELELSKGGLPAWAFWGLVAGFAVKIPLFPVHTWLPDAHTEAPAAGSVMLAGVMLKMGVYGLIRFAIPLYPELSWQALPLIGGLAAFSTVYGALCAMAQSDLKRLIAYSSVAHLGFCVLGVFSRNNPGMTGASLQMLNHGITTGALFLLVGFLYERTHKRGLADFGGLAARAPWLTFFFAFSTLASIGLPGLNGFVGEALALFGAASALPALALGGAVGVTLAPAYALPAFQAVFWGPEGEGSRSSEVADLNLREKTLLWTLCLLMLWIGLRPTPWLSALEPALRGLAR
jgi:NADH-quinone oxidoreductase subunit M